jgi:hypothetical protein
MEFQWFLVGVNGVSKSVKFSPNTSDLEVFDGHTTRSHYLVPLYVSPSHGKKPPEKLREARDTTVSRLEDDQELDSA